RDIFGHHILPSSRLQQCTRTPVIILQLALCADKPVDGSRPEAKPNLGCHWQRRQSPLTEQPWA
ncbi:MAG: hypothetical protein ACPIOQ_84075, partial [Promethearchaeia archaeon]